jgi:hypothetical protein
VEGLEGFRRIDQVRREIRLDRPVQLAVLGLVQEVTAGMPPVCERRVVGEDHDRLTFDLDLLVLRLDRLPATENLALDPEVRRFGPLERQADPSVALDAVELTTAPAFVALPLGGIPRLVHGASSPKPRQAGRRSRSQAPPAPGLVACMTDGKRILRREARRCQEAHNLGR